MDGPGTMLSLLPMMSPKYGESCNGIRVPRPKVPQTTQKKKRTATPALWLFFFRQAEQCFLKPVARHMPQKEGLDRKAQPFLLNRFRYRVYCVQFTLS